MAYQFTFTDEQLDIVNSQIAVLESRIPKLKNRCRLSDNVADKLTAKACKYRSGLACNESCSRKSLRKQLTALKSYGAYAYFFAITKQRLAEIDAAKAEEVLVDETP